MRATRYSTRSAPPGGGARVVIATLAVLFFCQQLHSSSSSMTGVCQAREIEATKEWTVIGENDTVASGMHVRIDMTTGEKWVKLMDDDDKSKSKTAVRSVHIEGDGAIVAVDDDDDDDEAEEPNYDFDMMHRTLAQLPEEEKARIGLPERPETKTKKEKVTPEQRALFEQQMKELWERRQEELRKFNEDNLADLPAILKDRIQRIRDYLVDPHEHLVSMDLEADDPDQVTHIVSVLVDLEYHLSDIDMTRDFYTLGGWPLLLSLMSAEVHVSSNQTTAIIPDDLLDKIHVIQAKAAWAIGTAVKNTGEFIPYATEEIWIGNHKTTAVDLMLAQFTAASQEHMIQSQPVVQKLQKVVYALGALLRNNRPAQVHFCASGGPELLAMTLTGLIEEKSDPHANKITKRLLMLADDIVSDVKLHQLHEHEHEQESKSLQVDEAIMQAFSTEQWCQLAVLALQGDPAIYETALLTVATLVGHCSWDMDVVQQAIFQIRDDWKAEGSDTDPDILKERLELIDSTMNLLTSKNETKT